MEQQQQHQSEETPVTPTAQKKSSISTPMAIVTGAAVIALAIIFSFSPRGGTLKNTDQTNNTASQAKSIPSDVAKLRPNDYVTNNTTAKVLVIEYSDSDCPFCKQFHETMKAAVDAYQGSVAWAYRFFPLTSLHPNAYTEALALQCVGELGGNDAFWNYLDTVISVTLSPDPKSNEALYTFAEKAGVSSSLLKTCLADSASAARVDADIAEAKSIGAQGTPFSVAINLQTGKQVIIPGAVPADYLKQTLDALLK